jgi:hypothetical protein
MQQTHSSGGELSGQLPGQTGHAPRYLSRLSRYVGRKTVCFGRIFCRKKRNLWNSVNCTMRLMHVYHNLQGV